MEREARQVVADVARFRPRTNQGVLAPVHRLENRLESCRGTDLSDSLGMVYLLQSP